MEAAFEGWLQQPWHILYSALRCMSCQEWHRQHVCPICEKPLRNSGGTHDAWAYFDGCLTHLSTAPKCIGSLLTDDITSGRGNSMIPDVQSLLAELCLNKKARDWLPPITIIHMAPGGHRQWPTSIIALLDRLSWLALQTRPLALSYLQTAVQKDSRWKPRYRCGPKRVVAPSTPFKYLDIGTRMGCSKIGEHSRKEGHKQHLPPSFAGEAILPVNTFHSVIPGRAATWTQAGEVWCIEDAWFAHAPVFDFRVRDPSGNIWGLPVVVPTCRRSSLHRDQERSMSTSSLIRCMPHHLI